MRVSSVLGHPRVESLCGTLADFQTKDRCHGRDRRPRVPRENPSQPTDPVGGCGREGWVNLGDRVLG
jgi:hypothetical protein